MNKLSIRDLDLKGKRVFIRVDFNVPLDRGKVGDENTQRRTQHVFGDCARPLRTCGSRPSACTT